MYQKHFLAFSAPLVAFRRQLHVLRSSWVCTHNSAWLQTSFFYVYRSVLSTNRLPILWIILDVMGSLRSNPLPHCLNTFTITELSWIHDGGIALFPWPSPIMSGEKFRPQKKVLDLPKPVCWKKSLVVDRSKLQQLLVRCHSTTPALLGATNARGVGRERRGNLRGGCMSK